jgi:hypothetical protein
VGRLQIVEGEIVSVCQHWHSRYQSKHFSQNASRVLHTGSTHILSRYLYSPNLSAACILPYHLFLTFIAFQSFESFAVHLPKLVTELLQTTVPPQSVDAYTSTNIPLRLVVLIADWDLRSSNTSPRIAIVEREALIVDAPCVHGPCHDGGAVTLAAAFAFVGAPDPFYDAVLEAGMVASG